MKVVYRKYISIVVFLLICSLLFSCVQRPNRIYYPIVSNFHNSIDFPKYSKIAVLPFADAPNAPQSGQILQGIVGQALGQAGFEVVERTYIYSILKEQAFSLTGATDPTQTIKLGKLLSVNAVVVGEVGQYATMPRKTDTTYFPWTNYSTGQTTYIPIQGQQWMESYVSVSLRVIDVETGMLLYSGSGQFEVGLVNPPQQMAENIIGDVIGKWVVGPGAIGLGTNNLPHGLVVTKIMPESPADKVKLQEGDIITHVNGQSAMGISKLTYLKMFWCVPGQKLSFTVKRQGEIKSVDITADARDILYPRQ